ncbi:MAG: ABC transporter ATP-binding protein [Oscillospiraceae bacterium]|nr:ABC transporter ATP-binding protein [Oscillospiraceae bacterium]
MNITIHALTKTFKHKSMPITEVLKNVNLTISQGELVAIQGKSGAGKTTLLNIIGCLDIPSSGQYWIDEQDILSLSNSTRAKLRNQRFGFIMQDYALINDETVMDNIILPAVFAKTPILKAKERANILLARFNLEHLSAKRISALSGGEKQRVAIIRALMNDPDCILADEPTGALDSKNSHEIMKVFIELNNIGKTIIVVTHDDTIANMCNRIVRIADGIVE